MYSTSNAELNAASGARQYSHLCPARFETLGYRRFKSSAREHILRPRDGGPKFLIHQAVELLLIFDG